MTHSKLPDAFGRRAHFVKRILSVSKIRLFDAHLLRHLRNIKSITTDDDLPSDSFWVPILVSEVLVRLFVCPTIFSALSFGGKFVIFRSTKVLHKLVCVFDASLVR